MASEDVFSKMRALLMSGKAEELPKESHPKVTVVGVGSVGMACAASIVHEGLAREIVIVDVEEDKLKGEQMDLSHGAALLHPVEIKASKDYAVSANSDLCVITAGARQKDGQSRLDLVESNVEIFKKIIPELVKHNPKAVFLVVTNPVDILTWVVWKLSGLPATQVIGSGTLLDSSRFRYLLSRKLNVFPNNIHGYLIGEHGDSSVPVWSGVTVGGVRLRDLDPKFGFGEWEGIAEEVKKSAYDIIKLKGYTSWSIGMCVAELAHAILKNSRQVHPVSVNVKGLHKIEEDLFLSMPGVLTHKGVSEIAKLILDESESKHLAESVKAMLEIQRKVKL